LSDRLASLGGELLIDTLADYLDQKITPVKQDDTLATYAPMLKKENAWLDFSRSALELSRQVMAYQPWPGAYLDWQGERLKILRAHAVMNQPIPGHEATGNTVAFQGWPAVVTAAGLLILDEVQPPGKKPMPGKIFLNGARGWA
jgi:methionyl-tRNA formyltransferase